MDVSDDPDKYLDGDIYQVAEKRFQDHYLHPLGDDAKYVRLESEFGVMSKGYVLRFIGRNAYERYIRETTGCLALDFSDFDTSALGFGGFVFF